MKVLNRTIAIVAVMAVIIWGVMLVSMIDQLHQYQMINDKGGVAGSFPSVHMPIQGSSPHLQGE
jgi:sensor domain CHASE-containing protein